MANDISGDSSARDHFRFESSGYLASELGHNSLDAVNGYTGNTSGQIEGGGCIDLASASAQYLRITQANMETDHPFYDGQMGSFSILQRWYLTGQESNLIGWNSGGSGGITAYIRPTQKLRVTFFGTSSTNVDMTTAFTGGSGYNNWYAIVITYNASTLAYWLNIWDHAANGGSGGWLDSTHNTGTLSAAVGNNNAQLAYGPSYSYDRRLDECICEAEVWDTTKIGQLIAATYTGGGAGLSIPIAMHHYKQLGGS